MGGYAFTMEESAYEALDRYISELDRHYSSRSEHAEIMEAFEDRIAELLLSFRGGEGVVISADIDRVVSTLGKPWTEEDNDALNNEECGGDREEKTEWWQEKPARKLMRDPGHRVIGGVCSGIAAYFKIDVVMVRLIYVLLFIVGIVFADRGWWDGLLPIMACLYPILWIAMPAPRNGREQKILEEAAVESNGDSDFWPVMGKVLRTVFGICFTLVGTTILIVSIVAGTCMDDIPGIWFVDESPLSIACAFAIIVLPALGFLWEGVKMLFGLKSPKWHPGLICFLLWFAALVTFGAISASSFL